MSFLGEDHDTRDTLTKYIPIIYVYISTFLLRSQGHAVSYVVFSPYILYYIILWMVYYSGGRPAGTYLHKSILSRRSVAIIV